MARRKTALKRRGKYQLNTMEDLKREADKSATWRGHALAWPRHLGRMEAAAMCMICGMKALIVLRPAGEEHIITGAAVLHTCPRKPDLLARREN
ncbi:hypothetical protein LCGC14_1666350 [marine sediment metagenome]|uniref:Uncharacterized protein n=1 Tax=marine sediment metagenome TaxID=412755 RepID=A0A0F9KSH5_9ZZZZ